MAQASQSSSLGNGEGKSEAVEFEILTVPPVVKITHAPEPRSKQNKPSFEGEASETEPVTVSNTVPAAEGGDVLLGLEAVAGASAGIGTGTARMYNYIQSRC